MVDHGLTEPLSPLSGQPERWPRLVIPIAVNLVDYPVPPRRRCLELGKATRRDLDTSDGDLNVQDWGTVRMSHQLQGLGAGLMNQEFDAMFLDKLVVDPVA